jgi:hypothetical protein
MTTRDRRNIAERLGAVAVGIGLFLAAGYLSAYALYLVGDDDSIVPTWAGVAVMLGMAASILTSFVGTGLCAVGRRALALRLYGGTLLCWAVAGAFLALSVAD